MSIGVASVAHVLTGCSNGIASACIKRGYLLRLQHMRISFRITCRFLAVLGIMACSVRGLLLDKLIVKSDAVLIQLANSSVSGPQEVSIGVA